MDYAGIVMKREEVLEHLIVRHIAGSRAYGTDGPNSDVDYRGVFCAPPEYARTPFFNCKTYTDGSEEDTLYYELCHFVKLCAGMNPNVSETLWVDREHIVFTSPSYEFLRKHRTEFLSTRIADTTIGYAMSELKKVERSITAGKKYNTKHAMHVVRLVRMGFEILDEGVMHVKRSDAKNLLEVRDGLWTFDDVIMYATLMRNKVKELKASSSLPTYPNLKRLAELTMEAQDLAWKK